MNPDLQAATRTIWDALHGYRETCIPEGIPEHDREWDDICHAMAILQEAAGCPERVDG